MSSIPPLFAHRPESAIDPAIVQQAIVWLVTLQSGGASEAERRACAVWREADAEHERAWQRLATINDDMRTSSSHAAPSFMRHVLRDRKQTSRRGMLKSLIGIGMLGGGVFAIRKQPALQVLTADHRTATGEQRTITLADGTSILLNTSTAIDVQFDAQRRQVILQQGEIMVSTAKDSANRPFEILTRHGSVQPIGTRFTVSHDVSISTTTAVTVMEGAVDIRTLHDKRAVRLQAGQQTVFTSNNVQPPTSLDAAATAWTDGMLVVERMRMADFVTELGRYRTGILRCDLAVADLRVSGAFPLRDTDAVLKLLVETLPIELRHTTRFWTTVGPRAKEPA